MLIAGTHVEISHVVVGGPLDLHVQRDVRYGHGVGVYHALQSSEVLRVIGVYGAVVLFLVSVSLLFGESYDVVRGAGVEQHELITLVVVSEGIVVRAKIFPLHVLLVYVRQSQQPHHFTCVDHFHADLLAVVRVRFVARTPFVHVDPCAT